MKVNAIRLSFLTCFLTLCQCASGPQLKRQLELKPGDKVIATYLQSASGGGRRSVVLAKRDPSQDTSVGEIRQTLVTKAVISAEDLYQKRSTELTKVIDNPGMQVLLDAWATSGFFNFATTEAVNRSSSQLILSINGQAWIWSKHVGMKQEQHAGWIQAFGAFLDVYNQTTAFYSNSPAVDRIRQQGGSQPRTNLQIRDGSNRSSGKGDR